VRRVRGGFKLSDLNLFGSSSKRNLVDEQKKKDDFGGWLKTLYSFSCDEKSEQISVWFHQFNSLKEAFPTKKIYVEKNWLKKTDVIEFLRLFRLETQKVSNNCFIAMILPKPAFDDSEKTSVYRVDSSLLYSRHTNAKSTVFDSLPLKDSTIGQFCFDTNTKCVHFLFFDYEGPPSSSRFLIDNYLMQYCDILSYSPTPNSTQNRYEMKSIAQTVNPLVTSQNQPVTSSVTSQNQPVTSQNQPVTSQNQPVTSSVTFQNQPVTSSVTSQNQPVNSTLSQDDTIPVAHAVTYPETPLATISKGYIPLRSNSQKQIPIATQSSKQPDAVALPIAESTKADDKSEIDKELNNIVKSESPSKTSESKLPIPIPVVTEALKEKETTPWKEAKRVEDKHYDIQMRSIDDPNKIVATVKVPKKGGRNRKSLRNKHRRKPNQKHNVRFSCKK
jgi:hypothetical protein